MKRLTALLLCTLLAYADLAQAEPSRIGALAGQWAADVSRLPIPEAMRPKRVTITFADAEGGKLATRVEVVDAAGQVLFAESVAELNGTAVPVKGELEADMAAASMPAPNVLVMQLVRGGVPGSTRVYTLSPDHQSMVETAANVGDDGRPFTRTNQFSRIR